MVFNTGFTVFQNLARVGQSTELSNGCILGAMCEVTSSEMLPENTVIYGSNCERRVQQERPPVSNPDDLHSISSLLLCPTVILIIGNN